MKKDDAQLKIRLPDSLKKQITALAEKNNRTINAEVVHLLSAAILEAPHNRAGDLPVESIVSLVTKQVTKYADKRAALHSFSVAERDLLEKLDSMAETKKKTILEALTLLVNTI